MIELDVIHNDIPAVTVSEAAVPVIAVTETTTIITVIDSEA